MSADTKLAIYDLRFCPVTFDFVNFLAAARLYFAEKTGDTSFDLLIVAYAFRQKSPRELSYSVEEKNWRLFNLILPILTCSPFVKSFSIIRHLPSKIPSSCLLYPPCYKSNISHSPIFYFGKAIRDLYSGRLHPGCFQAPKQALKHANNIFKSNTKKALISPRFSNYESSRNTNISHITALANGLSREGFSVGIIPDQEDNGGLSSILESTTNIKILSEASFSIPLRLALIEIANINLFTPSALLAFGQLAKSNPNFVCFDMHKPPNKSYTGDTRDYQHRGGMTPWKTYPYPWSANNNIFSWDKEFNCQDILQKAIYASSFSRALK